MTGDHGINPQTFSDDDDDDVENEQQMTSSTVGILPDESASNLGVCSKGKKESIVWSFFTKPTEKVWNKKLHYAPGIKAIHYSNIKMEKLKKYCKEKGVKFRKPCLDVPTCWNSMADMLKVALSSRNRYGWYLLNCHQKTGSF